MLSQHFVIVGSFLGVSGALIYLFETVKGTVRPNRMTFFLWSLASFIVFAAEIKQGVGIQSLFTFLNGFIPFSIILASFVNKKSYWKLEKFDFLCGALSLVGLLIWSVTKVGNIAIVLSILADLMAYVPTIKKSYFFPETENGVSYLLSALGAGITTLTITTWNLQTYAFPLYVLLLDSIMFVLIQFKVGNKLR